MNSFSRLAGCLVVLILALVSLPAFAQVSISIDIAPPPLIVEDQPACPDDGLIWTPGYWAYDPDQGEYYWVPGAWVQPPQPDYLWTPDYWGWENDAYVYHAGYWGPTVGFYGGINYGHGYWGHGYNGGRWENGRFAYNSAANNVGHVHNTYVDRSAVQSQSSRVSFNGGHGGIAAQPTPQEQQASQGNHVQATAQQQTHFQQAAQQRSHPVKVNKTAATPGAPGAQPNAQQAQHPVGQPAAPQPQAQNAQPAVKPQGQQAASGQVPQAEHKDQVMEKKPAAVEPQHTAAPNLNKPEDKPNPMTEQHAQQHQPAPTPVQPEQKAPAVIQHAAAPESHPAQAPGGAPAVEKHAAPPESHSQQQPHPEAQAPAQAPAQAQDHPQAPAGGGQGGGPGSGAKHNDNH